MKSGWKHNAVKALVLSSVAFFVADMLYKSVNNIDYMNREKCIVYETLGRKMFMFFEYFIELPAIVIVGVFLATLLARYFSRYSRLYPKNPVTAFIYGSLVPFCACAVIPLVKTMRDKINMRTLVTFIVASPLLSPYILMLSLSVLGLKYTLVRVACSFILALSTGYAVEFFHNRGGGAGDSAFGGCKREACVRRRSDAYAETYEIMKAIAPYLIVAGVMGMLIELALPKEMLLSLEFANTPAGTLAIILLGVPLYFCNGSEVILLRPMMHYAGLSLGTAIAFSLTSTAICVTSMVMLVKFMGRRLTAVMTLNIIGVTLVLSYAVNLLFG